MFSAVSHVGLKLDDAGFACDLQGLESSACDALKRRHQAKREQGSGRLDPGEAAGS
ncbi:hypothetical protein GIW70_12695 [Pseudomonas syringae]|nr:hypothetical protein [Pseudomonas syringae]MCF5069044.1 hypothetical protein [Pseudomonas syringae]